jgi:hypothetical protein
LKILIYWYCVSEWLLWWILRKVGLLNGKEWKVSPLQFIGFLEMVLHFLRFFSTWQILFIVSRNTCSWMLCNCGSWSAPKSRHWST